MRAQHKALEYGSASRTQSAACLQYAWPDRLPIPGFLLAISSQSRNPAPRSSTAALAPAAGGRADADIHQDPRATCRPTDHGVHFRIFHGSVLLEAHELWYVSLDVRIRACTHCLIDYGCHE